MHFRITKRIRITVWNSCYTCRYRWQRSRNHTTEEMCRFLKDDSNRFNRDEYFLPSFAPSYFLPLLLFVLLTISLSLLLTISALMAISNRWSRYEYDSIKYATCHCATIVASNQLYQHFLRDLTWSSPRNWKSPIWSRKVSFGMLCDWCGCLTTSMICTSLDYWISEMSSNYIWIFGIYCVCFA